MDDGLEDVLADVEDVADYGFPCFSVEILARCLITIQISFVSDIGLQGLNLSIKILIG